MVGRTEQLDTPGRSRTCNHRIRSQILPDSKPSTPPPRQTVHTTDLKCPQKPIALVNKGIPQSQQPPPQPVEVHGDDSNVSAGGSCSDKQNDKQSDKRETTEADLDSILEAWPRLPATMRTAIVTLVKAASVNPEIGEEKT